MGGYYELFPGIYTIFSEKYQFFLKFLAADCIKIERTNQNYTFHNEFLVNFMHWLH